jgi:hypothetical protein
MWNAQRNKAPQDVSAATRTRLIEHFLPDSRALGRLTGIEIPWLAGWRES